MKSIFDAESGLMSFLNRISDLIILNVLTIVCSIPIITSGAAFMALFASIRDILGHSGSSAFRIYYQHLKQDFRKATVIFLPFFVLSICLGVGTVFSTKTYASVPFFLVIVFFLAAIILLGTSVLSCLLFVNFENTLKGTIINAGKLLIAQLPRTLLCIVVCYWPIVLFFVSSSLFLFSFAFLLLFGFSIPTCIATLLFRPVMEKLGSMNR